MSLPVVNGVEVAMAPPTGYVVNFDDPAVTLSTNRNAIWIFGVEFFIATLFLIQRMYTNAIIMRKFLLDDYMILFAWVLSIGAQASLLNAYSNKWLGVHAWEMSIENNNSASLSVLATTLTYIPTTILSKLTLCFFYYRLSPSRMYQWSVIFVGFICAASLIGIWFSILFACRPISAGWDARIAGTSDCINRGPVYVTQAAFGCVTDLMLLALPIPTIWGLQMTNRHKLGLLAVFGIGSVTLVTSIVRLVLLLPSISNRDQSWSLSEGCLWVIVEANLLIMCGCLPTLRVFVRHTWPRLLGDKSQNASNDDQNKNGSYGLRTFGGSNGQRRKFDTLVELEHDLHFDRSGLQPGLHVKTDVNVYTTQCEDTIDPTTTRGETDSEDGILPTQTTTICATRNR